MMATISEDDLVEEFDIFGIPLDDPDIIDKLKEYGLLYRLEAGKLAAEWVAFKSQSSLTDMELTHEMLEQFERQRLSKPGKKTPKNIRTKKMTPSSDFLNADTIAAAIGEDDTDDIMDSYSTPAQKMSNAKKRQHTPENPINKRFSNVTGTPSQVPFSPASFSPMSDPTPSKKYGSRSNAGDVVCSHGSIDNVDWKGQGQSTVNVSHFDKSAALTEKYKYMFQKLIDKAHVLNDQIEDLAVRLQEHHKIEDVSHVALPVQDEVTVVGRVVCDSEEGKLNAKSVVLEGSRQTSAGRRIPVDLSQVQQYSLFPGQIVAMDGANVTGNKFIAKKVYEGVSLPMADNPKLQQDLRVMVAAGPFTPTDTLSYEPLTDLVKYIKRDKPDVCILIGPFVDIKHEEIENGNVNATFEQIFNRQVNQLLNFTKGLTTKLILVPSQRDAHHESVYPQPPYQVKVDKQVQAEFHRVQVVPDPCTLNINNVIFGVTSTDILLHLGHQEISSPPGSSDRLGRLAEHLITQQNYYPLYPSHEDVSVDYEEYDLHSKLSITPHVLITPSDLRHFIKDIRGCCCVNPARLTKGQVGGTFLRMVIRPTNDEANNSIISQISAEVVRV